MRYLGFNMCRYDGYVWTRVDVNTYEIGATEKYGLPTGERYY